MRYSPLFGMLALAGVALLPSTVHAQPRGPARPPPVTPYLAIGTGSNPSNYFTIVRPTLEARAIEKRQQAELGQLEQRLGAAKAGTGTGENVFEGSLQRTGHRVYFGNTSHYFPKTRVNQ